MCDTPSRILIVRVSCLATKSHDWNKASLIQRSTCYEQPSGSPCWQSIDGFCSIKVFITLVCTSEGGKATFHSLPLD